MTHWSTVLTDPAAFFHDRQPDANLLGPVVVVFLVGVLGLLSAVPALLLVLRGIPAAAQPIIGAGLAIGALFGLAGPFVVWLIYALLFYGISIAFGGAGPFRQLFVLTGWGFLPRILGAAFSAVVLFVALGDVAAPQTAEAMRTFSQDLQAHPLVRASSLVSIGIAIWSGYIWTHAVAVSRELTLRQAAVTVGIPVLLSIVLTGFGLLGVQLV
ncbi:MAG: YIP1 family protein [Halobacteriales archaeon]